MTKREDIITMAKQLLTENQGSLVLASVTGQGKPHVRYMGGLVLEDPFTIYLVTYNYSRKVSEIVENPNVELLMSLPDYSRVLAISGTAEIEIREDKRKKVWDALPEARRYFKGVGDPDFGVLCIRAEQLELWTQKDQKQPVVAKI